MSITRTTSNLKYLQHHVSHLVNLHVDRHLISYLVNLHDQQLVPLDFGIALYWFHQYY